MSCHKLKVVRHCVYKLGIDEFSELQLISICDIIVSLAFWHSDELMFTCTKLSFNSLNFRGLLYCDPLVLVVNMLHNEMARRWRLCISAQVNLGVRFLQLLFQFDAIDHGRGLRSVITWVTYLQIRKSRKVLSLLYS